MKPRVLIVNDDEAITQQLFWTLCEEYDVVTANDLQTAVRRATVYVPDVALLDLQLEQATESPEIALRIIEYIKAHVPESKILVMTSGTHPDVMDACATRGADGVLDKPFDTEVLLATMRRIAPRSLEVV